MENVVEVVEVVEPVEVPFNSVPRSFVETLPEDEAWDLYEAMFD